MDPLKIGSLMIFAFWLYRKMVKIANEENETSTKIPRKTKKKLKNSEFTLRNTGL
jgi:hypothetical protein